MSLISILIGEREFKPPPGITRSIRNFKIYPVFIKEEKKTKVKKEPKPPKPKKPPRSDLKYENMDKIVTAVDAGCNTMALIARHANISRRVVSKLARQLEIDGRIDVEHGETPKKYYSKGKMNPRLKNTNFVLTDTMTRVIEIVNNGANTRDDIAKSLGICGGYMSRLLRELVDQNLIVCIADKWPREYYPK